MSSQSPIQTRRSNTGRPRNSPSMANDGTPDQALRNLKINEPALPAQNQAIPPTTRVGEVSDDASIGSSRRHRRGGRKKNSRMAPAQEARLPWSERLDEGMSGLEDLPAGQVNGQKEKKEMSKPGEMSDNASVASSSRPRSYKRERRKKKKGGMAAVAKAQVPWSERVGRLGEEMAGPPEGKAASPQREAPHRQSPPPEKSDKGKAVAEDHNSTQENKGKAPDTGLRAFNIRRLRGEGPPIGISIDRGEEAEGAKKKNADEKGGGEGEKTEKPKPISIRLDINLEIEVFFKAAIKGDVTITFLE
ncbi:hypothetical protein VE01_00775 [Pseudogymnoascus verrucosus]|uniref:Uncharacterized protein n=1 Tax=Pseudogymnoascus verrucosus TaxID=342668 RepID=A0A2P2SVY0_9PEZI|nr:uncharacterized protein VE01_00775 [Pseudogymnoascus verrucosus]OBU00952.2 hypothetical protein VE01_00775 [Pseudogymnoascus verrucosus]